MKLVPDEVLAFAKNILERLAAGFGENWTQREIDGFFFNEYLNPDLKKYVHILRQALLGQEVQPFAARYEMVPASQLLSKLPPAYEYPYEYHVRAMVFRGNDSMPNPEAMVRASSQRFIISSRDLRLAILLGEPIPFQSITLRQGLTQHWPGKSPTSNGETVARVPVCNLNISSNKITPDGWGFIKSNYEDLFLGTIVKTMLDNGIVESSDWKDQIGANLTADFLTEPFPLIKIRVYPPFASAQELEALTRRALARHQSSLPGQASALPAIRAWSVYLLNENCGLSNREAISLWNQKLGRSHQAAYTMDEREDGVKGSGVSQPGEADYSKEKRELTKRILHCQSALTAKAIDHD